MIRIIADNLTKTFNRRKVLENISFSISAPYCLGITGKNGAGKSTLIKIIAGLLEPNSGKIDYEIEKKRFSTDAALSKIGFLSPYLQLYDEFSALENLIIYDDIRESKKDQKVYANLLEKVGLYERRNDYLRTFSSGMKQRLKIAFALSNSPEVLLFDEPTSNLDESGIKIVHNIMEEHKKNGILIVATNDKNDYNLFDDIIKLD
jgi:heme exporter protein A